ncbi:MarR family winged helix-turn-helix transcriptional regulator, partial [Jatrophihabitans sp. YIM 134969]
GAAAADAAAAGADEPTVTAARLERVAGLLLRRLRPTRPGDLTRSQSSMLATVRDHGPLSLAALAELEAVQPPTASKAVELLAQRGLLRREVDPADHRRQLIELAGGAADLLERRSRDAVTALSAELATLSPDRRSAIVTALPALEELVRDFGAR